ncbi:hypothetical protein EGW08_013806 [Elysia chlorotica]|uniref:Uncharacterized protein n=1 Tax=Elysia chlorotica TaxID=188477 RepID=A0A3S0ZYN3_ELYCH|nr:hypothetical protein EGW08_013806 [Elysia chlorotica]
MSASYEHDSVRIRLNFVNSQGENVNVFRKRWALISLSECKTIRDIENNIVANLRREIDFTEQVETEVQNEQPHFCELCLTGFWLPSRESSRILRDGDKVTVRTSSTPLNLIQTFDSEEGRKKKSKRHKKRSSDDAFDSDQSKTVEKESCKAKRRKEYSETHTPQEIDTYAKKKMKKDRLNLKGDNNFELDEIDKSNIQVQLDDKKKKRKKSRTDLSLEAVHANTTETPSSNVEMKENKSKEVADLCNEEGREYLQSLIKDRIVELTSESVDQNCNNGQVTQPAAREDTLGADQISQLSCDKVENHSRPNLQSSPSFSKNCKPMTQKSFLELGNAVSDKVISNQHSHLGAEQQKGGDLLEDRAKFALERNTPSDNQTLQTAGEVSTKRRRRRKKKGNRYKEADKQPITSADHSHSHIAPERDFSMKLPHHLQPHQNNRLVFDDDDDDEEDAVSHKDSADLSMQGEDLKSRVDESPSQKTGFYSDSNGKRYVSRARQFKHQKWAVSPVVQHLEKVVGSSEHVGQANSTPKGSDAETERKSDVVHSSTPEGSYFEKKVHISKARDSTNVPHINKAVPAVPKPNSFVSADDKFMSLLGNTRRQPASLQISPAAISRQPTVANSAEIRDAGVKNDWQRNCSTEARTNGHGMHVTTKTVVQRNKEPQASQETLCQLTGNKSGTQTNVQPPSDHDEVSVKKQASLPSCREVVNEGLTSQPGFTWPSHSNADNLPDMKKLPNIGDFLMYRILELSEDYCPTVSDYKKARVLEVDAAVDPAQLKLMNFDAEKKRQGRFELEIEQDGEEDDPDRYLTTVSWSDLMGVKLVS